MKTPRTTDDELPIEGESFAQRFSRRKLEARRSAQPDLDGKTTGTGESAHLPADDPLHNLTDADMPPLDALTEDSDYRGFLSEKVSESLRRAALRKLFHTGTFNVIDELDDYAEDFTTFEALGDVVTAEMRHRFENEAKKRAEALEHATVEPETNDSDEATDPADIASGGDPETGSVTDDAGQTATAGATGAGNDEDTTAG